MSFRGCHLIDFSSLNPKDIFSLFQKAQTVQPYEKNYKKNAALMFLEPSTRTQMSFDVALRDVGVTPVVFTPENSSLKKGETLLDTLFYLEAFGYDLFVIRHGDPQESLKVISQKIKSPIINAGEGVSGHPTQALLDIFTIYENKKDISKEKILFIGDVKHSRVVSSNVELLKLMNIEYAYCGPKEMMPQNLNCQYFENLEKGLEWATVAMALRNQLERHKNLDFEKFKKEFVQNYCLTKNRIKDWNPNGMILHPGPFNREVEISSDIFGDPRIFIFKQAENARKVRRALIDSIFEEKSGKT